MTIMRNPAPLAGDDRVSETVITVVLDDPEDTRLPRSPQPNLPAGFDPNAMPILARQWFGLPMGEKVDGDG